MPYAPNLPLSMDSSALEDLFTRVGNVRSARILCDTGSTASLGRGVVEMSTIEETQNCLLLLNGEVVGGSTLVVRTNEMVVRRPVLTKVPRKNRRLKKVTSGSH